MTSPTLTIDDPTKGGSDPGTWATALAHSPCLVAVEYVDEARRASLRRMVALDENLGFYETTDAVTPCREPRA